MSNIKIRDIEDRINTLMIVRDNIISNRTPRTKEQVYHDVLKSVKGVSIKPSVLQDLLSIGEQTPSKDLGISTTKQKAASNIQHLINADMIPIVPSSYKPTSKVYTTMDKAYGNDYNCSISVEYKPDGTMVVLSCEIVKELIDEK